MNPQAQNTAETTVRLPVANVKQQDLILKGLREGIYPSIAEAKRNFSDWLDVSFLDNVDPNTI